MSRIQKLPEALIAQVAAGEVIQDPSNVVKELIDNALDAQAMHIQIHLTDGGLTSLKVTDNGIGMSPEELRLSWHHHTTSKISSKDDLTAIQSFGFRGEALSSIAAMSDLTLKSRPTDSDKGHELFISGQKLITDQPTGMPSGTIILVEHLFRDVPGRKKAQKSKKTHVRNIEHIVLQYALAHPAIRFEVFVDNKPSTLLPSTQKREERIATFLGNDAQPHLIPILWEDHHLRIHGYIGKPQLARRQRKQQYIAINNRPVRQKNIAEHIRLAFNTLLEPHLHPTFVLFIEAPHDIVDTNIHPQKESVALHLSDTWLRDFQKHIFETLQQHDVAYRHGDSWSVHDSSPQTVEGKTLKHVVDAWQVRPPEKSSDILQIHDLYLIFPTEQGMMMIDQHAAHERILYEQFKESWKEELEAKKSVPLETPQTLTVSPADEELLETHLPELTNLGFELEHFSQKKWVISAVPELYADRDVAVLVRQVIDDLAHGPLGTSLHPNQHRLISYLACRTAIKAGETLSLEERHKLIHKLAHTNTQYTCPHGRPVMVELSLDELDKLFKRS